MPVPYTPRRWGVMANGISPGLNNIQRNAQFMKIILTGANGFLGQHLLKNDIFQNALAIGRKQPENHNNFKQISLLDNNLQKTMDQVDIIIHAAGRAHIMKDTVADPLNEFRRVNTLMTLNLARQAAKAGVKRFIFISSIKVLGENTITGQKYKFNDNYNPQDEYSISKMEAEIGLQEIGTRYGMEVVIIRPPLIYGKNVKGNFARLLKLATLGLPLPIGAIKNRRSMISIENLIDFIILCMKHKNARNRTFLVSDDCDMSTPEIVRNLSTAIGTRNYIFNIPLILLYYIFKFLGKNSEYQRLAGSMQVDLSHTKKQLQWEPPVKVIDSFKNIQ